MLKSSAVPNIQLGAGPSSSEEKTPRRAAVKRERMRVLDELLSDEPVQKSQGSPMAESVQESQPSEGEESRLSPLLLSVLASQPSQEMPALAGQALQGPETDPRDTPGCSSCGSYEAEPSMEEFSSSYPQELSTSKDVQTTQQPKYQSSSTQTSVSTRIKRIQISVQMSDKGTQYVAPETEDIEEKTFESKGTLCKLSDEDVEMEEEEEKEVALEEMEKEEEQKSNSDSPGFTAHGSDESSSDALSSPEKPLKKTSKVRGRRPAVSVSMKPGVDVLPQDDTKYLVFEKQLLDLFRLCRHCRSGNVSITKRLMGTMLIISSECWTCNKTEKWESQSYLGNQAAGNVLLSAATLFAGGSWAKMQRILKNLKVAAINEQTFYKIQREILQPVIERKWAIEQQKVADELSARGTPLVIAGDGRADSPGHSAKFGVYTGLEVTTNKIIDIELVQSNEVKSSFHMELEGFKRFQAYLGNHDMEIAKLITDRHRQIAKHVREMCPTVLHMFDVWHIAKAVQKKVRALGKQKYCGEVCAWEKSITNHIYWVASSTQDSEEELRVAKWNSLANHMQGIHEGHSDLFPECLHGSLEGERAKKWLRPGTKVAEKFDDIICSRTLLKDIKKMSCGQQTSSLESFHSVINQFAPKMKSYGYHGILCRLHLAALHHNANSDRQQATTSEGERRFIISKPKYKPGSATAKAIKEPPTYSYVEELMTEVSEYDSEASPHARQPSPPPLSSEHTYPSKEDVIQQHQTRFSSAHE